MQPPVWWIETIQLVFILHKEALIRVAWIETLRTYLVSSSSRSHPVRVRGLKLVKRSDLRKGLLVAPRAGAWIETRGLHRCMPSSKTSHPVRVRGLKRFVGRLIISIPASRTPCGCVD